VATPTTPLDATAAPAQPAAAAPTAPAAERRITSVLFGDLVGFTTLSESRDPDDVRELLSRYFTTSRTIVERYGGTAEKFIGDAVTVVWGVPRRARGRRRAGGPRGHRPRRRDRRHGRGDRASGLAMRVGVVAGEVAVTIGAADLDAAPPTTSSRKSRTRSTAR
jgi:class 3 adenylate cyclase